MSEPSEPPLAAPGWLYDGQSAVRHPIKAWVDGDDLVIEGWPTIPVGALQRLDMAGHVFGRGDIPGWRLGLDEPIPAALATCLPAATRYGGLIDRIGLWRAALLGLCLSAILLFGASYSLEIIAHAIPYSWEQRLGDAINGDLGEYACRDTMGQAALTDLSRRLSPASRPMRVTVVNFPVVNAVALPGGRILIFRGLIDQAASPDEVAGVLAHEIGHVEHRHVMVSLLRHFGIGMLLGSGGSNADYGQALLEARYSRQAENEADGYSIDHLVAAGISPAATAGLFDRLGRKEANMPRLFVYMASHPASAERRKRFAVAAKQLRFARTALRPEQWAALRAMCGKTPAPDEFDLRF